MTLWSGRFSGKMDPKAWDLNASLPFDKRLATQDVRGSLAWAHAIAGAGILSAEEYQQIQGGLEQIQHDFEAGSLTFHESDEDIHSAVERRLKEIIGPVGGKLHTGRSRNDQVATDFRLWVMQALADLEAAIRALQSTLIERAESDMEVVLPGYTHLQRAQPILLSHWWLSFFWQLQRDRERFQGTHQHTAVLPLGSGALAGCAFDIDREALAQALGFTSVSQNSLDAVSDRDFAAEFLFDCALFGSHLSKLAESVVLYSSSEFGFMRLTDAFSTGSSLMPQKSNPDVFELTRAKAGTLLGLLTGFMAVLKGLPSTYDKDLQEDKQPVFQAFDTLMAVLPVLSEAIRTLTINAARMRAAIDPAMLATDLAEYLVRKGVPFREAHELTGQAVRHAIEQSTTLDQLSLADFKALSSVFEADVSQVFDISTSIARKNASGGTAPEAVRQQLTKAREILAR